MVAVENLISAEFKPARTVVLAFGFDEESSGLQVRSLLRPKKPSLIQNRALEKFRSIYCQPLVKTRLRLSSMRVVRVFFSKLCTQAVPTT